MFWVYSLAAQLDRQNCVARIEGEDAIEVVWLLLYISAVFTFGVCSSN